MSGWERAGAGRHRAALRPGRSLPLPTNERLTSERCDAPAAHPPPPRPPRSFFSRVQFAPSTMFNVFRMGLLLRRLCRFLAPLYFLSSASPRLVWKLKRSKAPFTASSSSSSAPKKTRARPATERVHFQTASPAIYCLKDGPTNRPKTATRTAAAAVAEATRQQRRARDIMQIWLVDFGNAMGRAIIDSFH